MIGKPNWNGERWSRYYMNGWANRVAIWIPGKAVIAVDKMHPLTGQYAPRVANIKHPNLGFPRDVARTPASPNTPMGQMVATCDMAISQAMFSSAIQMKKDREK